MSEPTTERPRVSDERLAEIVEELFQEDQRARAAGEAHGNYGEEFGATILDLRDARASLAKVAAALAALSLSKDEPITYGGPTDKWGAP